LRDAPDPPFVTLFSEDNACAREIGAEVFDRLHECLEEVPWDFYPELSERERGVRWILTQNPGLGELLHEWWGLARTTDPRIRKVLENLRKG
jgi:hypothetical protein